MTNNVLPFPIPEGHEDDDDIIMMCPCGGATFYQHIAGPGNMECSCCGEIMTNDIVQGVDFQRIKEMDSELLVKRSITHPTTDLALKRVTNSVNATTMAVIVIDEDGAIRTWSDNPEGDAQKKWFHDRLVTAGKLIC